MNKQKRDLTILVQDVSPSYKFISRLKPPLGSCCSPLQDCPPLYFRESPLEPAEIILRSSPGHSGRGGLQGPGGTGF
ncbi:hypothetical protein CDV31_004983 [Fusarium ambrosium]|uniref:Uncharacterized protein n=1 Tax=Fusarium ambrosium TaxID=131363 RepID=A0A428UMD8_9HYPO|nr:hypothetical protein CDV31_004983 [Fusarium ambrosium]